jgi:hypothetical protein
MANKQFGQKSAKLIPTTASYEDFNELEFHVDEKNTPFARNVQNVTAKEGETVILKCSFNHKTEKTLGVR